MVERLKNKRGVIEKVDYNIKKIYNNFIKDRFLKLKNYLKVKGTESKNNMLKYKKLIKPTIIILIIYLLAIYPIIRANFNYIDDLGRALNGYKGWDDFSRFTNQFLSTYLHTGTYLADISPLPQIIAVIILVIASVIILDTFKKNEKLSIWYIISILPIGLCPYYLECLSYKFDAPYMALSILGSVFPLLFSKLENKKGIIKYCIASIIGTIIMCTTYQASSGIYPVLIIFLCFKLWSEKDTKSAIKLLICSVFSYLVGLLIFKFFIVTPISSSSYVSNKFLDINVILEGTFNNLTTYYKYVEMDFRKIWSVFIIIIAISFIIINTIESQRNKIISFFASIIVCIAAFGLAFGLYPALEKPLFVPRAMYGIGIVIALLCLNSTNTDRKYSVISKLFVFILCWLFFVHVFIYGNGLAEQKRYTEYRIEQVVNSLNELEILKENEKIKLNISGNIGKSPVLSNTIKEYPILSRLIPDTFGEKWIWSCFQFYYYFDLNKSYINATNEKKWLELDLPIIEETMNYIIKGNKKNILVILK